MQLAALFSDHAVLQRDVSIPVWGWTKPNLRVRVRLGGLAAESKSGRDGRFLVRLPPQPAGGPFVLTAETPDPSERCQIGDVWMGEVWVCSGQSNMEWTLGACGALPPEAETPGVRMFTVPRTALPVRQTTIEGAAWQVASAATVGVFSAVGFHFGLRLHRELGVAVGLLNTSWGGTRIETWMSREALAQSPITVAELARYELLANGAACWDQIEPFDPSGAAQKSESPTSRYPLDPGNGGVECGWARPDFNDGAWETHPVPGAWQQQGHNYSGVFWYRRELDLPADWQGHELVLDLGAVDKQDITYFNGEQVGATGKGLDESCWSTPRHYRVPGRLVRPGRNLVAVRAYSFVYSGGLIGPAQAMRVGPADSPDTWLPLAGSWRLHCEHDLGQVVPAGQIPGPGNPNSPGVLFDNMIAPLLPYAIRGATWYQGESNAGNAGDYAELLRAMIRDWRAAWGQGAFTFLTVQLANFMQPVGYQDGSAWARVREAQLQSLADPQAGLAVAIDIGEAADIHPRNKRDVGARLAQWALARTYGKAIVPSGPLYAGMAIEAERIRLRFTHVGGGLKAGGDRPLQCFAIAGGDRTFRLADAIIEGDTVVVSHPRVVAPVAVRYAWADNPDGCNLINTDGLPASPFRTDCW